jgi:hypothetical protein
MIALLLPTSVRCWRESIILSREEVSYRSADDETTRIDLGDIERIEETSVLNWDVRSGRVPALRVVFRSEKTHTFPLFFADRAEILWWLLGGAKGGAAAAATLSLKKQQAITKKAAKTPRAKSQTLS